MAGEDAGAGGGEAGAGEADLPGLWPLFSLFLPLSISSG